MYCNQCGAKNSDTGKFCIACGNALQQSAAAASAAPAAPVEDGSAVPQDAHEQSAAPAQPATPKKKKGGKGVLIVLIVLLLLVGGGVAAWQLGLLDDYLPSDETTTWQGNYDLGVQFVKDERYQDAIAAFREAIAIDPAQPDVYLSLAELYVIIDEPETAIEVLEEGYEATEDEEIAEVLAEYIIQYPGTPDEETAGEEEETIAPTPEPTAEPTPEPALELVWELEPSLAFDALKSMCTTEYAVSPFSEFYTYQKDGLWGIVDSSFEVVLEPTSSEPYRFCEMGHVMYVYDEETLALLDEYGLGTACAHGGGSTPIFYISTETGIPTFIGPAYDGEMDAWKFCLNIAASDYPGTLTKPQVVGYGMGREDNDTMEGYSFEASDSVVGYLAADGSVLLAPQYNYANSFSSGAAAVSYDTVHWAYINEAGEYITDFDYLAVDSFVWYENYVIGRADESAAYFVDGYCVVTKDGAHFGVIDLNGEEVIACEYEGALALHDGRIVLQQDGVWGVVNLNA